jgi:hypothetical protein
MSVSVTYCDNCGEPIPEGWGCFFGATTVAVSSANVGESVSLCEACFGGLGVATSECCTAMLAPGFNGGPCPECGEALVGDGSLSEATNDRDEYGYRPAYLFDGMFFCPDHAPAGARLVEEDGETGPRGCERCEAEVTGR